MAGSIANLILRLVSQKGDAATDVEEVAAALQALDKSSAEATAEVNTDQLAFDTLVTELEAFDKKKVKAKAEVETDTGQLNLFTKKLEGLASKDFIGKFMKGGGAGAFGELTQGTEQMKLDLDTGLADAKLHKFHDQLLLFTRDQHVNIDVDRSGKTAEVLAKLGGAFGGLASKFAGMEEPLVGMAGGLSKVSVSMGAFGAKLGPGVAGVIALAVAIGTALVAAFAALAASAAIATAALIALGVALAGAILPMIAVAIPAFLVFNKIMKIMQQRQTEAAQAAQKKAQADKDARSYAQQHADSERALADAIQASAVAKAQAYREMEDAIERVSDAQRSLEQATLSQEQASLNVDKAKQALEDFRKETGLAGKDFDAMFKTFSDVGFDPARLNKELAKIKGPALTGDKELDLRQKVLDVKQARQDEKESVDHVSDSERDLTRARQDALPFQKQGIKASQTYAAALDRVADSQRDIRRLISNRAFDQQNKDILGSESSTKALNKQEQNVLKTVDKLIAAFKYAFGPAGRALIDGFATGIGGLDGTIRGLRPAFTNLGKAMGGAIGGFFKQLSSPAASKLFDALIQGATILAPLIAQVFGSFLSLLTKLAVAAMPALIPLLTEFTTWLTNVDKNTSVADIAGIIADMMPHLQEWIDLAKELIPAFFNLLVAIAPYGLELLRMVTGIAKQLGEWAKSKQGREDIKTFFSDAVPLIKLFFAAVKWIFDFVLDLVVAFGRVVKFFQKVMQWSDIVDKAISDFFKGLSDNLSTWWDAFKQGISDIGAWFAGLATRLYNYGVDAITGFINGIKSMASAVKDAVVGVVEHPIDSVKGFLGIGSPSKLMMGFGHDVGRGFELGINASATRVTQAAVSSLAAPVVAAGAAGATAASGYTIQNQTVNLPAAPGHDQMGDPRHQAAQFAREMRRRGRR